MKTKNISKIAILASCLFLFSCGTESICTKGQGTIETRTLSLSDFSGVDLSESGSVTISQGSTQEVKVTGHPNILDRLETDVSNGVWDINLKRGCYRSYSLSVEITVPNLDMVAVRGSGDIKVNDFSNQHDLDLNISGSGSIELNTFDGLQNLDVRVSGSGDISGLETINSVQRLDMKFSGSGNYNGYPIASDDCEIKISGSADCFVTVHNTLNVNISGSGNVFYKGSPSVNQHISGSGKVRKTN